MSVYLTLEQAAERLKISKWTIYGNGPEQYGGQKIGGLWRFPEDQLGKPPEKPKLTKESNVYHRRFPPKKERRIS